jgi:hypothetical protein
LRRATQGDLFLSGKQDLHLTPARFCRAGVFFMRRREPRQPTLLPAPAPERKIAFMANDLDDIRASTGCPACGRQLSVSYRTLRLRRTVECQGCGETIKLEDDTPVAVVQKLIDEANPGD